MKLMVLDGNSIVNRAYYAVRPLTTKDGFYTQAIYGFVTILQRLQRELEPDGQCVCFDMRAPTFRHEVFESYKAQRKGMPDELAMQMPVLKEMLEAMNIRYYQLEGWEADDLLGTIARINEQSGHESILVTGDRDALQLVSDKTTVALVSTAKGQTQTKLVTPELFHSMYGFAPKQLIDLKGLMGDSSDNIPGVPGVGEKTATDLILRYHTVEEIYANLPELDIKDGVRKKLEAGAESAAMSKTLATILCEAPIRYQAEDIKTHPVNQSALLQLFQRLEFHKLMESMQLTEQEAPASDKVQATCSLELVDTQERAQELLAQWRARAYVNLLALPELSGVAVLHGDEQESNVYLIHHQSYRGDYQAFLKQLFSADIKKVTHDCKPLMHSLLAEGLPAEGFEFDTAVAAYLLSPTDGSYSIAHIASDYAGISLPPATAYTDPDAFGMLGDHAAAMGALGSHLAAIDLLYERLSSKLAEQGMTQLFEEIELPLCRVLAEMELEGVLIDRNALQEYGRAIGEREEHAKQEIYALAGHDFNINSPKQLGVVLFEELALPPVKKTKTGYSTNVEVLEKLRGTHPIIDAIMDYRVLSKLKSTYVDGLSKVIEPDGRIRTTFQNLVTATGRLSSTEPNLQNIPVRTELGAKLRYMFVAKEGCVLVDADYSQIELRLLAHIADDKLMQEGFHSGDDIHRITASQVFNVPLNEVTAQQRSNAKAVNFGIVYGISEFSLSQDIHVSRAEAKAYMDAYFEKYSGVQRYMTDIVAKAKQQGYVSTLYGRRRALPELSSAKFNLRSFGERVALNMPIQGTAADIIKLAMIHVSAALKREGLQARLILQVHDELIVEAPEAEAQQVAALLKREMESVANLKVPLLADASIGKNWGEAKG